MLPRRHLPRLNCERQAVLLRRSRARGEGCERTRWIDTSVEIDGDSSIIIRSRNREESTAPIALTTRRASANTTNSEPSPLGVPINSYIFAWLASVSMPTAGYKSNRRPAGLLHLPSALAAWNVRPGSEETNVLRPPHFVAKATGNARETGAAFGLGATRASATRPPRSINTKSPPPTRNSVDRPSAFVCNKPSSALCHRRCMLHASPRETPALLTRNKLTQPFGGKAPGR